MAILALTPAQLKAKRNPQSQTPSPPTAPQPNRFQQMAKQRARSSNDDDLNDSVSKLQEQRQNLQERAVTAQTRELSLLRKQLEEQQRLEEISVGLLRKQVGNAETSAAQYQQQLSLMNQSSERQAAFAEEQNKYTSLLQGVQNQNASNRASYARKMINRQKAVSRSRPTAGVFTALERRI